MIGNRCPECWRDRDEGTGLYCRACWEEALRVDAFPLDRCDGRCRHHTHGACRAHRDSEGRASAARAAMHDGESFPEWCPLPRVETLRSDKRACQKGDHMDTLTRTAPERIWLGVSDAAGDRDRPFPQDRRHITWCSESTLPAEVEYVRATAGQGLRTHWADQLQDAGCPGAAIAHADWDSVAERCAEEGSK